MGVETVKAMAIRTALSGPAAGVVAAARIASAAGYDNVITCNMGGTSLDVSLVTDGKSSLSAQTQIDFGMVVRTPMIEISTIGAGGGSVAHIDSSGLPEVGPESAGADPGPVAYGFGNDRPTVTDANLVLGWINLNRPVSGKLARLDIEAAGTAVDRKIGIPLGLETMEAAEAIIRVANARMAGASGHAVWRRRTAYRRPDVRDRSERLDCSAVSGRDFGNWVRCRRYAAGHRANRQHHAGRSRSQGSGRAGDFGRG